MLWCRLRALTVDRNRPRSRQPAPRSPQTPTTKTNVTNHANNVPVRGRSSKPGELRSGADHGSPRSSQSAPVAVTSEATNTSRCLGFGLARTPPASWTVVVACEGRPHCPLCRRWVGCRCASTALATVLSALGSQRRVGQPIRRSGRGAGAGAQPSQQTGPCGRGFAPQVRHGRLPSECPDQTRPSLLRARCPDQTR